MTKGTSEELADFLRFCRFERRLAPMTCTAYERDVSACLAYVQRKGLELTEVKVTHLRAFLAEERNGVRRCRARRERQLRSSASSASWSRTSGSCATLRCRLRTPKKREALPDVLTMGELEGLLGRDRMGRAMGAHFPGKPERDRLLLALMAYGGLRRSELLGLDWDDVDLSRRLLRIRNAKGGRRRTIPI